jgi:hypothetical protein
VSSDPYAGVSKTAISEKLAKRLRLTPEDAAAALGEIEVADVGADIHGVRLGMTPEEALAVLEKKFPDAKINAPKYFTMAQATGLDFSGTQSTADTPGAFATKASVIDNTTRDVISLEFAVPPARNVVQSITRKQDIQFRADFATNKTSADVYYQALVGKYGPPTKETPLYSGKILKWLYPAEKMDCHPSNRGAAHPQSWVLQRTEPEKCATALLYSYAAGADGVVTHVEARLANVGQMYLNVEVNRALREEFRRQVNEAKSKQATKVPDL